MIKSVVIGTKAETISLMNKITGIKSGKEGQPSSHCLEFNNKYGKKDSIKEAITISPYIVDPVN